MRVLALGGAVHFSVARLAPIFVGHPPGRGLTKSVRARLVLALTSQGNRQGINQPR